MRGSDEARPPLWFRPESPSLPLAGPLPHLAALRKAIRAMHVHRPRSQSVVDGLRGQSRPSVRRSSGIAKGARVPLGFATAPVLPSYALRYPCSSHTIELSCLRRLGAEL